MATLEEVAYYLASTGVGTAGTNLFYGTMPDTPDDCVVVYAGVGFRSEKAMGLAAGSAVIERPVIDVQCRNTVESTARSKAQLVHNKLDGRAAALSGTNWLWIEATAPPFDIGRDENGRYIVGVSFEGAKRLS